MDAEISKQNVVGTIPLNVSAAKKNYSKVQALKGVSFEITRGGVVAILGPNGAGKTTLIKSALGLEKLSAGEISLFGHKPGRRAARARLGVMLQDTELPDLLTGRELLELFASYYERPLNIEEAISLAGISGFIDKRYKKMSGGQKRRIQFALAIIGDPDLLFLDEPTTGLDIEARKSLWDVVRKFSSAGKHIILTTHYIEEADMLADRIIILREGEIIADAPKAEIRDQMGGATIQCQTKISVSKIKTNNSVSNVEQSGAYTIIRSSDSVATLRDLLAADPTLSNLTITQPKLEDIFSELTK